MIKANELVDVLLEDGEICLARVVEDKGDTVRVSFLCPVKRNTFSFEDDIEDVPRDAIQGFYDTDDMSKTGMYKTIKEGVYEKIDEDSDTETDPDFSPDEYDSVDDENVTLVDSDEEVEYQEDVE